MYTLIHFDSRLLLILVTKNTNIWHLKLLVTIYLIQKKSERSDSSSTAFFCVSKIL